MPELIFLAHRIPYPPDKGDKIRSWNFFAHLAERYRIHLGCFIDDPRDWEFTDFLRKMCGECCFVGLRPKTARLMSLRGLVDGRALTLPYYANRRLARWTRDMMARPEVTRVFIYCSAMAQYVADAPAQKLRRVADLVDVDSEKWADYAHRVSVPWRWLYAREAKTLRRVEKEIAARFDTTIVATDAELALLKELAPEATARLRCVSNGVDSDYFSPARAYPNPYKPGVVALAFVGAMDYWPNVDAVAYFAREILPAVRQRLSAAQFFIVGSNPAPEVRALAAPGKIVVTGRVPDVRPYVAHAAAIVAPLRIGRGVQNKVLEGMAMAKPVVGSPEALTGIDAVIGTEVLLARTPEEFAETIYRAAATGAGAAIGCKARARVVADYDWSATLRNFDSAVDDLPSPAIPSP